MKQKLKTPEEAKYWLKANGITVTEWARQHGFNRLTVTDLLNGRRKGTHGEGHLVAVALGIKADPEKLSA